MVLRFYCYFTDIYSCFPRLVSKYHVAGESASFYKGGVWYAFKAFKIEHAINSLLQALLPRPYSY